MYVALKEYMVWFESGNRGFVPTEADVKPSQAAYLAAAGRVSSDAGVVPLVGSNQVVQDMLALTGETDNLAFTAEEDYTAMVKGFSEGSPFASLDDVFSGKHLLSISRSMKPETPSSQTLEWT
jgi:hypothetical protein